MQAKKQSGKRTVDWRRAKTLYNGGRRFVIKAPCFVFRYSVTVRIHCYAPHEKKLLRCPFSKTLNELATFSSLQGCYAIDPIDEYKFDLELLVSKLWQVSTNSTEFSLLRYWW